MQLGKTIQVLLRFTHSSSLVPLGLSLMIFSIRSFLWALVAATNLSCWQLSTSVVNSCHLQQKTYTIRIYMAVWKVCRIWTKKITLYIYQIIF